VTALRTAGGGRIELAVDGWMAEAAESDLAPLAELAAPVLDVGCGPGRIALALAAGGRATLGIDTAPAAVAEAARRGAPVLCRSVFDPLPGEGRWGSAVLLDGNIGIGGDPVALLRRVGQLLRRAGRVVAEVGAPGTPTERTAVRIEPRRGRPGPWFPWATVAADRFADLASVAGLVTERVADHDGRWFATAARP
jgi:SAM-dependent methyltransferase